MRDTVGGETPNIRAICAPVIRPETTASAASDAAFLPWQQRGPRTCLADHGLAASGAAARGWFKLPGMLTDTAVRKAAFLRMLRNSASVAAAATELGIRRRTAYQWRDSDREFAAAWAGALSQVAPARSPTVGVTLKALGIEVRAPSGHSGFILPVRGRPRARARETGAS